MFAQSFTGCLDVENSHLETTSASSEEEAFQEDHCRCGALCAVSLHKCFRQIVSCGGRSWTYCL